MASVNCWSRPAYDPRRYTDSPPLDRVPILLPSMPSPFDDAPTPCAMVPPNRDLISEANAVAAFDMIARSGGRSFLVNSWRRDQVVCVEDGAVYATAGYLPAQIMPSAVYLLARAARDEAAQRQGRDPHGGRVSDNPDVSQVPRVDFRSAQRGRNRQQGSALLPGRVRRRLTKQTAEL